jgi:hypothetical protein
MLILIVAGMTSCSKMAIDNLQNLQTNGKFVTGRIIGRQTQQHNHNSTEYDLVYKYVVDGVPFTDTESVSASDYNTVPNGTRLQILYLPSNPGDNHIGPVTNDEITSATVMAVICGLVAMIVLVALATASEMGLRKRLRLLTYGIPTQAVVANMETVRSRNSTSYYLTCNFWTGQQPRTERFSVSSTLYRSHSVGSNFTVLYLPENPSANGAYSELRDGVEIV